ncbi:DNA polymerase alpha catalytic subunit-like [Augochlora pura]
MACSSDKLSSQVEKLDIEEDTFESIDFSKVLETEFLTQTENVEVSIGSIDFPSLLTTNADKEDILRFYWYDAYEDPRNLPGIVYLFGKIFVPSTNTYCSCCLEVINVPRRIYLLPRKHINTSKDNDDSMKEVYDEFCKFANKSGIKDFHYKTVTKNYAFEQQDVPLLSKYLEVKYSAQYPAMPYKYSGPSIKRVFGTTVNGLELLIIERNIKGPCWLDVKCSLVSRVQSSWCKLMVTCKKMENISVCSETQASPPLGMMTLNVRTVLNSVSRDNEIAMVAVLIHQKFHFEKIHKPLFQQHICLITCPYGISWPEQEHNVLSEIAYTKLMICDNEKDLLEKLLKIMAAADLDLLIGYDCGFQFDALIRRMYILGIEDWSSFGKLKRNKIPLIRAKVNLNVVIAGRPMCDIQVSSKESKLKVRGYDLQSLCRKVLNKKENECKEMKRDECKSFYATTSKIDILIKVTLIEALHILSIAIELDVFPLALEITCIAGNILSKTLTGGRIERNEYLLLHAFHLKNYITPDKRVTSSGNHENTGNKKATYTGGLVLNPKKGFYDKLILLMDFNSLYPSIIQEYNLCFTTVPGAAFANIGDLAFPESNLESGIIPTEIRKLVWSRVNVKKLMNAPNNSPKLKMQYNIRQLALKEIANSLCGCFGASYCRFYAKGLAALVTAKGREILMETKCLLEGLNYEVIYGDTDSIMINTNSADYEEACSVGEKIKQEVNKLYKMIELDIDRVFRYLLLLQKKKYAAVKMTQLPNGEIKLTQEHKGMDIVRRDWCQLACDVGKKILDQLFSNQSNENQLKEISRILRNVANDVRTNQVSLSSLVITKLLSKDPNQYRNPKPPHAQVAVRANKEGGRMWRAGDAVPYIICDNGTKTSINERAYLIDECKKSSSLKIDVNYYLRGQVFPIVSRICEPIKEIDDALLSKNFGFETIQKPGQKIPQLGIKELLSFINRNRYKDCTPFLFKCINETCRADISIKDVVTETPNGTQLSLASCSNPECTVQPWTYLSVIKNSLTLRIKELSKEYNDGWFRCTNPLCENRDRDPLMVHGKYPHCKICKESEMIKEFTESQLYHQVSFYSHIFDVDRIESKDLLAQCPEDMRTEYRSLKQEAEKMLRRMKYSNVCLDKLFPKRELRGRRSDTLKVYYGSDDEFT